MVKKHKDPTGKECQDLKQNAIKYKAFQHTFSKVEIDKGLNEKIVLQKLKESKHLQSSYNKYLEALEKNPIKTAAFPWDSRSRRALYWILMRLPVFCKWFAASLIFLFTLNYIPGPTQHIVEFIIARAIYDTAGISRLPDSLETYAHSANIVDSNAHIIKSYGKRSVTAKIPDKVKKGLLSCEDHYLLPHPKNPWYVNTFFIHAGVSWFNLAGAVKDTIMGKTRGASTIVMQNAKKILGNDDRTIANKLEEIIIAYMLVSKFGKEQNLDFYINTVPVGSNIYGFTSASKNYFKKNLEELNYQQLVTIGSFVPNHNRALAMYEVWRGKEISDLSESRQFHLRSAISKVNLALTYLLKIGEITEDQHHNWLLSNEESIRKIGFRDFNSPLYGEEEWTSWNVIREVTARKYLVRGRKISGAQLILDEKGDVIIETGVDLTLIDKTKEIISQFIEDKTFRKILEKRNKKTWKKDLEIYEKRRLTPPYSNFQEFMAHLFKHLNIGVIVVNQQGRIISYVGGKEFQQGSKQEHGLEEQKSIQPKNNNPIIIDLMNKKAKIAPASTIKPIISYYTMLVGNSNLHSVFTDKPIEYKFIESEDKKVWLPRNWYQYDSRGRGANRFLGRKYSLLESQVISINTIFARLYSRQTIRSAMLSGFDKIGLDYNYEDAKYWPFGIGASDVPVQQWLGVYNAFLDGHFRQPSFVKRILINDQVIYDAANEQRQNEILLFDSKKDRDNEMLALYEVCNRGSGATMKKSFKHHKNLTSGKTGTSQNGRTSLFVSHFNPYHDRITHTDKNMTMIIVVTTNTGGHKSVGTSVQGPTQIAGKIYDYLFKRELQKVMDNLIEKAKSENAHFRNNHLYWANVNKYMNRLLNGKCGKNGIYEHIYGVDGYSEALEQILNPNIQIYSGKDELFEQLVEYYCDQDKLIKMNNSFH